MTQTEERPLPNDLGAMIIAETIDSLREAGLFTDGELKRLGDVLRLNTPKQLEALTALFAEGNDESRDP
jgi:hypothetical protein